LRALRIAGPDHGCQTAVLGRLRAGVQFKDGSRVERDDGQVTVLANKKKRGKIAA